MRHAARTAGFCALSSGSGISEVTVPELVMELGHFAFDSRELQGCNCCGGGGGALELAVGNKHCSRHSSIIGQPEW